MVELRIESDEDAAAAPVRWIAAIRNAINPTTLVALLLASILIFLVANPLFQLVKDSFTKASDHSFTFSAERRQSTHHRHRSHQSCMSQKVASAGCLVAHRYSVRSGRAPELPIRITRNDRYLKEKFYIRTKSALDNQTGCPRSRF